MLKSFALRVLSSIFLRSDECNCSSVVFTWNADIHIHRSLYDTIFWTMEYACPIALMRHHSKRVTLQRCEMDSDICKLIQDINRTGAITRMKVNHNITKCFLPFVSRPSVLRNDKMQEQNKSQMLPQYCASSHLLMFGIWGELEIAKLQV